MFQTLFGGVLAIAAIYYLLKMLGVSNYWRGIISGLLPVSAYMGWSIIHWPGGDVLSMHMAVYMATATVLTLVGGRKSGERKALHWGPKLIMGFFLLLFAIDGSLLLISGQGIPEPIAKWLLPPAKKSVTPAHTAFSGVVPHGEEAAKTISQHRASTEKQNRLGWQVQTYGLEKITLGKEGMITVAVRDAEGKPLTKARAALAVIRPGATQPEQMLDLVETDPGDYRAPLNVLQPGVAVVVVRLQRDKDKFELERQIELKKH
ncbi:MAG: FixH family protein [Sulfuricellaceae bacterium]|nr:FixH family protein [Sulfuricellaceae bacterium]